MIGEELWFMISQYGGFIALIVLIFIGLTGAAILIRYIKRGKESQEMPWQPQQPFDPTKPLFKIDPKTGMPISNISNPNTNLSQPTFDTDAFLQRLDTKMSDFERRMEERIRRIESNKPRTIESVMEEELMRQIESQETDVVFNLEDRKIKVFGEETKISLRKNKFKMEYPWENYTLRQLIDMPTSMLMDLVGNQGLELPPDPTKNDIIRAILRTKEEFEELQEEEEELEPQPTSDLDKIKEQPRSVM